MGIDNIYAMCIVTRLWHQPQKFAARAKALGRLKLSSRNVLALTKAPSIAGRQMALLLAALPQWRSSKS